MGLVGGLLGWLGAPGSIVLVVSTVWALWHAHEIFQAVGNATIYARFVGLAILLGVLGVSGLVPGLHVQLDAGALLEAVGKLWRWAWSLVPVGLIGR